LKINSNKGITVLTKDPLAVQLKTLLLPENIREKLGHHQITAYHLAASEIFFGTEKGSLLIIEQQGQNVQVISFQNDAPVSTLAGNDQGLVFIGTRGNGLFVFDGRQKRITSHHKETEIKSVLKLYPDSGNRLWIESLNEGISKIDLTTGKYRHYTQALGVNPDLRPTAQCGIMEDENKTVWLTLKGGGFGYYDDQSDEITYFYNKPGDPESRISNFVNCFYKDPAGVLWLSTYFKGIEKITFYRNKFRFIQPSPLSNLSISNEVRALLEDSKGFLWVATKKQELFLLDREYQTVKKIDKLNGQPIGMVYAMYEDSEGNILLGTKGNGLFRLARTNGNKFSKIGRASCRERVFRAV
jgi:ligand-binding sensor domain-containing protein